MGQRVGQSLTPSLDFKIYYESDYMLGLRESLVGYAGVGLAL